MVSVIESFSEYSAQLQKSHLNIPLFFKPWWLEAVLQKEVVKYCVYYVDSKPVALSPIVYFKQWGYVIAANPEFTQSTGVFWLLPKEKIKEALLKKVYKLYLEKLGKCSLVVTSCRFENKDLYLANANKYIVIIKQTQQIELFKLGQKWRNLYNPKVKSDIRFFNALGYSVRKCMAEDVYRLSEMTFKRQGKKVPYSRSYFINFTKHCEKNRAISHLAAQDAEGNIIAAASFVWDDIQTFYLVSGINKCAITRGAMTSIIDRAIKESLNRGSKIFDFEGSMIPSIAKFFKSFGAVDKYYYQIYKSRSWILSILFALRKVSK